MPKTDIPVEQVALTDLHADPANARTHGDRNLQAIKNSLQQFGQVEPLVCQKSTKKIIGGNGRFEAMRSMGWKTANVVWLNIDNVTATALGIALNRTAELAEWDKDILLQLQDNLKESHLFDLNEMAISDNDLKELGCEMPDFGPDTDEPPRLDEKKMNKCPQCGHEF